MVNGNYSAFFKSDSMNTNAIVVQVNGFNFTMNVATSQINGYNSNTSLLNVVPLTSPMNPQHTTINVTGSSIVYSGAWINTTLTYQPFIPDLKETITISSAPKFSAPADYLQYQANCLYDQNLAVYHDGLRLLHPSSVQFMTQGEIDFNDATTNQTYFFLPTPNIRDSVGNKTVGNYGVLANNGILTVYIRFPVFFMDNAVFPIVLDPTFSDGFESNDFSAYTNLVQSGGTFAVETANPYQGTYDAKAVLSGIGSVYAYKDFASTYTELYCREYKKFDSLPSSTTNYAYFLGFQQASDGSGQVFAMVENTGGTVYWGIRGRNNGVYTNWDSAITPVTGQYYCVELYAKISGTVGVYTIWVDGTQVLTETGLDTDNQGNIAALVVGLLNNAGTETAYSDCVVADTSYIGPISTSSNNNYYVNGQNPKIDAIADVGTHSNFTAQQSGPNLINDTLTEANVTSTWGTVNAYVNNNYTGTGIDSSTIIGSSSNFTAQKYTNTNYDTITEGVNMSTSVVGNQATGSSYSTMGPVRDVIFQNFTAPTASNTMYNITWYGAASSGTITWCGIIGTLSGSTLTKLTNGQTANATVSTGAAWHTAAFSTPPTISAGTVYWIGIECNTTAVLRFYYSATTGGYEYNGTAGSWAPSTITLSHSNDTNYCINGNISLNTNGLNMQENWTGLATNVDEALICVKTGTLGGTLALDYWTGSVWTQLSSSLSAAGWNNVTIKNSGLNYLTATFTIRFRQFTLHTTAAYTFQIYSAMIQTWNATNYNLMLEENFTSVPTDVYGNRQLCAFMGPSTGSDSETAQLDVWCPNNSSWSQAIASLTANAWNNYTILDSNLVAATVTVRFQDNSRTNDYIQSTWSVDALLLHYWNTTDTTSPTYTTVGATQTVRTVSTTFYCLWADETNMSGFIFGTNNTGSFTNQTWTSTWTGWQTTTSAWGNYTVNLNDTTGNIVQYEWWANDTSNNWNNTGIKSLTVTLYPWSATPTFSTGTTWSQTKTAWTATEASTFSKATSWSTSPKWTAKIANTFSSSTTWSISTKEAFKAALTYATSTVWSIAAKWTSKITDSFSSTTSWSLSKYVWTAKNSLTYTSSTTWIIATKFAAKLSASFSSTTSWSISKYLWGAKVNPTFSSSTSWNNKDSWTAKIANTFASSTSWNVLSSWSSKITMAFSSTITWASKALAGYHTSPSYSSSTSWATSTSWAAKITNAFSVAATWTINILSGYHLTPSFTSTLQTSISNRWTAKIAATFSSTTSWATSFVQTSVSHFIVALSYGATLTWNTLTKWSANVEPSFTSAVSWLMTFTSQAHIKIDLAASLSTLWNPMLKWTAQINPSFASSTSWISTISEALHNFYVSLSYAVTTSWNVLIVHIGIITGEGGADFGEMIALGIIAITAACLGTLIYTRGYKRDDDD